MEPEKPTERVQDASTGFARLRRLVRGRAWGPRDRARATGYARLGAATVHGRTTEDSVSERRTAPRGLVLYTRARCGVCRTAEQQVRRELRTTLPWRRPSLRLVDIDVDSDPDGGDLVQRYGVRVPVLVLDGVELSELQMEPGVLRRALRRRGEVR